MQKKITTPKTQDVPKTQYPSFQDLLDWMGKLERGSKDIDIRYQHNLGGLYQCLLSKRYDLWFEGNFSIAGKDGSEEAIQSCKDLQSKIEDAMRNSEDKQAKEFLENITIVFGAMLATNLDNSGINKVELVDNVKENLTGMLNVFLRKLDEEAKDDKIKYDALSWLSDMGGNKSILLKISENPHATAYDLYRLQKMYKAGSKETLDLFARIEKKAEDAIKEETKKNLPNINLIKTIINDLIKAAKRTGKPELIATIETMYDINVILNPFISGAEYIATMEESKLSKIAELEAKLKQAELALKELETEKLKLQDALERSEKGLGKAQDKINELTDTSKTLTEESEKAKKQTKKLQDALESREKDLGKAQDKINELTDMSKTLTEESEKAKKQTKKLLAATKDLQIGIGSRGIKKMRNLAEEILGENYERKK